MLDIVSVMVIYQKHHTQL